VKRVRSNNIKEPNDYEEEFSNKNNYDFLHHKDSHISKTFVEDDDNYTKTAKKHNIKAKKQGTKEKSTYEHRSINESQLSNRALFTKVDEI
jgi:hypothetical protein